MSKSDDLKRYAAKHPEKYKTSRRKSVVQYSLKKKYGLTLAEYDAILALQNNVCAVCKQPERKQIRGETVRLAVDHCHVTGKVRGLLCRDCNCSLGFLKEDVQTLRNLIDYLTEHKGENE